MHAFFLTAALAAAAMAAPAPFCTLFDDNYDDLPSNPAFPEANPAAPTHLLKCAGAKSSPHDVDAGNDGFKAHSANNVAQASLNQDLFTNGFTADFRPFGRVERGPNTQAFDLCSFFFACSENTGTTAASEAESCTIAVQGFYVRGQETPEARFQFAANMASPNNPMVLAELPVTFVGLQNVTFGIVSSATGAPSTVLSIDDLVHCNV
ncbi:hypothetical protein LTR85_004677 [Meristemomyces frigidus]|nr:hypothetical protein LTR85_004677 [Meristemomyces frigidus]